MRAAEWIATVPWCITEPALAAMISIAERQPLDDAAERLHGPKSLALRAGTSRDDRPRMQMRDGVAIIRVDGPIFRYADFFSDVSGGVTTEALARDLQVALDDPRVDAILFAVDSPGGEATGIGELADAIYAARGKKPITAYVEGYGASAAYWIASAADRVVVDPSALLGSIGTVMSVPNPAARPQPARAIEVVSTQSPKKRVDPSTQAGQGYLQQLVDDMTEVFITAVMRNRGLSREQVLAVEGGLRIGQQAVDAGLADALGAEEAVIADLQQQAEAKRRPAPFQPRRAAAAQESPMKLREMFAAMFAGAADAGLVASDGTPAPVAASLIQARELGPGEVLQTAELAPVADQAADRAEIARLKAALAEREQAAAAAAQEAQRAAAATFAARMVAEGRALPVERDAIVSAHLQAALAGPATLQAVEAAFSARPAHSLTQELVQVAEPGQPLATAATVDPAETERLLKLSPLGRAALTKRGK